MELACTKKLLDYLGVKAEKVSEDMDPLFGWAANLLIINRRKTLVAVHTASRSMFVLYGLTAKQLPQLQNLVIQGIRTLLESECVRPEIIEKYLNDCGRELTIRANSSKSAVAQCNKACRRVKNFSEIFVVGDMFQKRGLLCLNSEILAGHKYSFAYEVLLNMLKERYGGDILSGRMLELEVELDLDTPCKRVVWVPANLNFYQLHLVLQGCFEWKDYHLHQFVTKRDIYERPIEIICLDEVEDWGDLFEINRKESMIATLEEEFRIYPQIDYEYDFGDGWVHTIRLKRVIEDCPQPWPSCVLAIGDAPMEDCGGPYGFAQVMEALNDSSHPDHQETSDWVSGMWWHPLDVDRINLRLRYKYRYAIPR